MHQVERQSEPRLFFYVEANETPFDNLRFNQVSGRVAPPEPSQQKDLAGVNISKLPDPVAENPARPTVSDAVRQHELHELCQVGARELRCSGGQGVPGGNDGKHLNIGEEFGVEIGRASLLERIDCHMCRSVPQPVFGSSERFRKQSKRESGESCFNCVQRIHQDITWKQRVDRQGKRGFQAIDHAPGSRP